jgi:hypothetical protein
MRSRAVSAGVALGLRPRRQRARPHRFALGPSDTGRRALRKQDRLIHPRHCLTGTLDAPTRTERRDWSPFSRDRSLDRWQPRTPVWVERSPGNLVTDRQLRVLGQVGEKVFVDYGGLLPGTTVAASWNLT